MMKGLLYLALAIVSEVFGSTMLKLSEGFTQAWPIGGVIAGFLSAFTFLSFSLKTIDLSSARMRHGLALERRLQPLSGFCFLAKPSV